MMSSKSLVILFHIFLILIFQSTCPHSFPLTEQEAPSTEQEFVGSLLTEKEIGSFKEHDIPLFEQNIDTFYCQSGSSLECCPLLARKFASEHHSRVATIILINNIGYRIELVSASLESGRWITSNDNNYRISCVPQFYPLENGQAEAFSSVTSSFLGGVKGFAIFYINDGRFSNFIISWSVPTIGSPKYEILGHDLSEYYNIVLERDLENTVFRVIVKRKYYQDEPTSFWTFFTMIPPLLIIPCCCCRSKDDPSERRNMLHSVSNLDPPNYAPPAYTSYSSIPNRESGNRHSNNNPFC